MAKQLKINKAPKTSPKTSDLQAQLDALRAENEALRKAKAQRPLTLKISDKGALSVYGMGRFPVTLYREQWERLLAHTESIGQFLTENASSLSSKS